MAGGKGNRGNDERGQKCTEGEKSEQGPRRKDKKKGLGGNATAKGEQEPKRSDLVWGDVHRKIQWK